MQEVNQYITEFLKQSEGYLAKCDTPEKKANFERWFEGQLEYAKNWHQSQRLEAVQNSNQAFKELSNAWKKAFVNRIFVLIKTSIDRINAWETDKSKEFTDWAKNRETPEYIFKNEFEVSVYSVFSKILEPNLVRESTIPYLRNFFVNTFLKFSDMVLKALPNIGVTSKNRSEAIALLKNEIELEFQKSIDNYGGVKK